MAQLGEQLALAAERQCGKCGRRADVGFPQRAAVARAGKFWGERADVGVTQRADVGVTQRVTSASASAGGSYTRGKERADARRICRAIFAHFPGRHTGETEAAGTGAAE